MSRPLAAGPLSRRTCAEGFSLVEILIALAILVMASGLIIVDHTGTANRERLKAASRRIAGFCERARSEAISRQVACLLELDFTKSEFRFVPDPIRDDFGFFVNPDTEQLMSAEELADWDASFEWEPLPREVFFVDIQVSAKMMFDGRHQQPIRIRFPTDGSVDPFVVHLKNTQNDVASVVMNGLTGVAEAVPEIVAFLEADATDFTSVMGNAAPTGSGGGSDGGNKSSKSGGSNAKKSSSSDKSSNSKSR